MWPLHKIDLLSYPQPSACPTAAAFLRFELMGPAREWIDAHPRCHVIQSPSACDTGGVEAGPHGRLQQGVCEGRTAIVCTLLLRYTRRRHTHTVTELVQSSWPSVLQCTSKTYPLATFNGLQVHTFSNQLSFLRCLGC